MNCAEVFELEPQLNLIKNASAIRIRSNLAFHFRLMEVYLLTLIPSSINGESSESSFLEKDIETMAMQSLAQTGIAITAGDLKQAQSYVKKALTISTLGQKESQWYCITRTLGLNLI
jgi:ABC-type hemin transport system ATPase subunit